MVRIGIVVQARLGSSRLPSKIIKNFAHSESILDILLKNISNHFIDYFKVLASSAHVENTILNVYALKYNFKFFQGDEYNVLQRFIDVGEKYELTHVLRICSDNPFLRMDGLQTLINSMFENPEKDYISFRNCKGVPTIKTHIGLFAELVTLKALKKSSSMIESDFYREHVTNFVYENPDKFDVLLLDLPEAVKNREDIRLTIDDQYDFVNLQQLYQKVNGKRLSLQQFVRLIDKDEELLNSMLLNIKKYSK